MIVSASDIFLKADLILSENSQLAILQLNIVVYYILIFHWCPFCPVLGEPFLYLW